MIEYNTVYFEKEGNENINDVLNIAIEATKILNISKLVIFSARTSSVFKLKEKLRNSNANIDIIVATFPYGKKYKVKKADEIVFDIPEAATREGKNEILEAGCKYIQGGIPLEPIKSCTGDNSTEMIVSTLSLLSKGLCLCVNAAIMAVENGYIGENESVISISGDTAIVVKPTIKNEIFSGDFKIERILCKPL
jgi:hypothetical protein